MHHDTIWLHIDTERDALADILDTLEAEQWRAQSLCEAWTVRDVAAHVAWQDVRLPQAVIPLLRARFRPDVMIRDTAIRAPWSPQQIIGRIRALRGRRAKPPFVSDLEPLIDILVHTQDICLPLGIEQQPAHEAVLLALPRVIELNEGRGRLRAPLRGVRLVATDADWTHGEGEKEVQGPLAYLLLTLAGREAAHARLSGDVDALG